MAQARSQTWQQQEEALDGTSRAVPQEEDEEVNVAKEGPVAGSNEQTWTEFGVQTAVGLVPVVGPVANACYDFANGHAASGLVNLGFGLLDVATWGSFAAGRAAASASAVAAKSAAAVTTRAVAQAGVEAVAVVTARSAAGSVAQLPARMAADAALRVLAKDMMAKCAFELTAAHATSAGKACAAAAGLGAAPNLAAGDQLTDAEVQGRTPIRHPPMRTLGGSNFRKLYDHCTSKPSREHVEAALPTTSAKRMFCRFLQKCGGNLGEAAVKMWTDATVQMYRPINAALISDNGPLLEAWTPLIRTLNNYLLRNLLSDRTVVRRKSFLSREQASALHIGSQYRLGMYVATSTRLFDNFPPGVGGHAVRIEFHIPGGCTQACFVDGVSEVPGEQEVLIVPYSAVKVVGMTIPASQGEPVTVKMELLQDSLSEPVDLPTILA